MASLFDTVKQNGQVLNVAKSSGDSMGTTGQLAASAGLPSAPTAPVQAASIGATPKQAAMAATPAGLKGQSNALLRAVKGPRDLATAVRERQVDATQTAAQQAQATWAAQLGTDLAGFAGGVASLIPKALSSASAAATGEGMTLDMDKVNGTTLANGVTQEQFTSALHAATSAGSSDTDRRAAMATINQGLNKAFKSADELLASGFYSGATTPAGETAQALGAHGYTPDKVTLDLLKTEDGQGINLGGGHVVSFSDLARDLGVSPDTLPKMSIDTLMTAVKAVQSKGFQTEAQYRTVLSDPTASMQERGMARQMLQGMGAQGVTATEASVQKLTQQVESSNQVTVGGKSMSVDDLLSSAGLKGLAKSILDNPGGPEAAQFPDLATWVQKNQGGLVTALAGVTSAETGLAGVYADNQAALSAFPGAEASNIAQKVLNFNVDGFADKRITDTPEGKAFVGTLNAMTKEEAAAFADAFGASYGETADKKGAGLDASKLASLSHADLQRLGFLDAAGVAKIKAGLHTSTIAQEIQNGVQESPETVAGLVGDTAAGVSKSSNTLHILTAAGIAIPKTIFSGGTSVGALSGLTKGMKPWDPTSGDPPPDFAGTYKATNDSAAAALADPSNQAAASVVSNLDSSGGIAKERWPAITTTVLASSGDLSEPGAFHGIDQLISISAGYPTAGAVQGLLTQAIQGAVNKDIQSVSGGYSSINDLGTAMSNPASAQDPNVHKQMDQTVTALNAKYAHADGRIKALVDALYQTWQATKATVAGQGATAEANKSRGSGTLTADSGSHGFINSTESGIATGTGQMAAGVKSGNANQFVAGANQAAFAAPNYLSPTVGGAVTKKLNPGDPSKVKLPKRGPAL